MKLHKSSIMLGLILAFALFVGFVARADEVNFQTEITAAIGTSSPGSDTASQPCERAPTLIDHARDEAQS